MSGAEAMEALGLDGLFDSLDASVRIEGHDRQGLERLLRYCARPAFALERIERIDEEQYTRLDFLAPYFSGQPLLRLQCQHQFVRDFEVDCRHRKAR